ncbi:MAG: helix-turn-helix domain-containing protein, partial [Halioglobus sp.]
TTSQLSRIINTCAGVSFYEFVNGYRVDEARKMLLDSAASEKNMLEVSLAAGFNSLSTFYTHFRKRVGMTPKKYRSQQHLEME